ncbi:MAG: J domain-containing protein [Gammaproteobacteria bacterium]|nr:J domain-containing protein [Gammaproteobacteria bacterium]
MTTQHINYELCYQLLDVTAETTWQEVRQHYRRLLQKWHPDRVAYSNIDPTIAERRFKEIQLAYQTLETYYLAHDVLPTVIPETKTKATNYTAPTPKPAVFRHTTVQAVPKRPSLWLKFLLIAIASGLFTVIIIQSDTADEVITTEVQSTAPNPPYPYNKDNLNKTFTYGSTMGEVNEVQGIPDKIENNQWYFGKSLVTFHDGRVVSWISDDSSPLRVSLAGDGTTPQTGTYSRKFHKGSSKGEVRQIQGEPMQDLGEVWIYGTSKIYFKDDRVAAWVNSTLSPLKAE